MKYAEPSPTIPKQLYHGTSFTRWLLIQRQGLRGDAPRLYKPHPKHPKNYMATGYVYLTREQSSALYYAFKVTEVEHRLTDAERKKLGLDPEFYQPVVLAIDATGLTGIEVDPEARSGELWFRHKGSIHPRHIVTAGTDAPLDRQQPEYREAIDFDIRISTAYERYDVNGYVDSLISLKPEYLGWRKKEFEWIAKYDPDFHDLVKKELRAYPSNVDSLAAIV